MIARVFSVYESDELWRLGAVKCADRNDAINGMET
jgi:hypothetical protein